MRYLIVITVVICASRVVKANLRVSKSTKNDKFSLISDATIDTICCYFVNQSRNVVLSGKNLRTIMDSVNQSSRRLQVYIQNSPFSGVRRTLDLNPPVFLVVATSQNDLDQRISTLKTSSLWNIRQPHFILDELTDFSGCQNAFDFLRVAWSHKLLFSIFVCHQNDQVMLYTFNPFTNTAPTPWISVKDSAFRAVSPWTLYSRVYGKEIGRRSCKNLHWDKTMELNGFKVKAVGFLEPTLLYPTNLSNIYDINGLAGYDISAQRAIYARMNVTVLLTYKPKGGYIDKHGIPINHTMLEVTTGRQDVMLLALWLQYVQNCSATPQHYESGLRFVLQRKIIKLSSLEKILHYLGWKLILATVIISVVSVIFLRYSSKQTITHATLELVVLLANVMFMKKPSTVAARLFFGPILFYFLIFHGVLNVQLSALLTKPVFEPDLNTVEDLETHLDYKLYSMDYYKDFLPDKLKSRINFIPGFAINSILNDPSAISVVGQRLAWQYAAEKNLHLSRELMNKGPLVFVTNHNWPLQERFSRLVLMIFESHLPTFWNDEFAYPFVKIMKEADDKYKADDYAAIALDDLAFILFFLIIGMCCATIVFLIEIKFWRYCRFIIRNRRAQRLVPIRTRRRVT